MSPLQPEPPAEREATGIGQAHSALAGTTANSRPLTAVLQFGGEQAVLRRARLLLQEALTGTSDF